MGGGRPQNGRGIGKLHYLIKESLKGNKGTLVVLSYDHLGRGKMGETLTNGKRYLEKESWLLSQG